jgi:hypothetical protein
MNPLFRVSRNPDGESRLPYLVWLPIEGGLVLKARDAWPRLARVFCSDEATPWGRGPRVIGLLPQAGGVGTSPRD